MTLGLCIAMAGSLAALPECVQTWGGGLLGGCQCFSGRRTGAISLTSSSEGD